MNLAPIITDFFSTETNSEKLQEAAFLYFDFLSNLAEISNDSLNSEDNAETILESGKAISPMDAARCVLDSKRTSLFLRGIEAAIFEAKNRFPNEKIEVLYAGCGPFAALAVPFCFRFSSGEIGFTLIDIHRRSLECAEKIFQQLDCEDFIDEYIQADASIFRANNNKKFHIVITETMQKTLEKEPQVAITLNLAGQLRDNGIFIPQKITVEAFLAEPQKEFSAKNEIEKIMNERINLGKIFELTKETALDEKNLFQPKIVKLPAEIDPKKNLLLSTKLTVFDSITLNEYNSGLTFPTYFHDFKPSALDQKIEFRYVAGKDPHFEYHLI